MVRLKELNLLFLEDNIEFAKNTVETLSIFFKNIYHHTNIGDSLNTFKSKEIDIIISDIKLGNENGLDFIITVRKLDENIPIIVLSAHKDEEFLFKAIPLNIQSYELKPLNYTNLMFMLKNISSKFEIKKEVSIGKTLKYNYLAKELYENSKAIKLTKKEILFIELLIKNKKSVLTNDLIEKEVYKDGIMSDAAVKNLLFRLRKKVDEDFVTTISNVGYRLSHNL